MPKILFVNFNDGYFWSHRADLALTLKKKGWQVFVTTGGHDTENLEKLKDKGITPVIIPAYNGVLSPLIVLRLIWGLRKKIQKIQPDIVHAISLKYAFLTGLSTLFLKDVRQVFTIAGLGYLFSRDNKKAAFMRAFLMPFLKLAFRRKNAFLIFQNVDDKEKFSQNHLTSPRQNTIIRGSGVNTSDFPETKEPEKEKPVILMPTRLIREKGIDIFIRAAGIVKEKGYDAIFILAGGTDKYNPSALSEKDMKTLLDNSEVIWRGKIQDMPRMYQRSHIVVYPSYYNEGVPKVLLEAASSARPIVTTNHTGCKEVVQDGVNGLLIPVKDSVATANAIINLINNPKKRKAMGQENRRLALEQFDVSIINSQTIDVYKPYVI